MAVDGRIPVRHEDVFPVPVIVMSVDPVEDFDKRRAGAEHPQDRDKQSGMRMWAVSVIDPSAPAGKREVKVKVAADVQPVPPGRAGASGRVRRVAGHPVPGHQPHQAPGRDRLPGDRVPVWS